MKLTVSETSRLMGISVRTLHYYDEIGLLKPSDLSGAGYRFYDEESLAVLQQILFYRELEFPLKEIGRILSQPDHDRRDALRSHRELLLLKQKHLADLLRLVNETLGGTDPMEKNQFTFADIEEAKNKYAAEARERWGHTEAYRESEERYGKLSQDEKTGLMNESDEIYKELAALRHESPDDPKAQALVRRWQDFITRNFYECTDEILSGLGEMYAADSRFTENIDRYGEGTAQFISDAIRAYCGK